MFEMPISSINAFIPDQILEYFLCSYAKLDEEIYCWLSVIETSAPNERQLMTDENKQAGKRVCQQTTRLQMWSFAQM